MQARKSGYLQTKPLVSKQPNARFGSEADSCSAATYVRFGPEADITYERADDSALIGARAQAVAHLADVTGRNGRRRTAPGIADITNDRRYLLVIELTSERRHAGRGRFLFG